MGSVIERAHTVEPRHAELLRAIGEALSFSNSGEVVVRSGTHTGRIFAADGRVAWVTASPVGETLGDRLLTYGIGRTELVDIFEECRKSGSNFAETIVDWKLLERDVLRGVLLSHVAACFFEILRWDPLHALVLPSNRRYHGSLTYTLHELLAAASEHDTDAHVGVARALAFADEPIDLDELRPEGGDTNPPQSSGATPAADVVAGLTEERKMNLDLQLKDLKEIKGYKASGIMNYTGEMIASDSADPNIDLNLVGASFNDIFRSAHEVCNKIGLDACTEDVIQTPKGIVLMRCTGVAAKAHVHLITILSSDGNHALTRMTMEKVAKRVVDAL